MVKGGGVEGRQWGGPEVESTFIIQRSARGKNERRGIECHDHIAEESSEGGSGERRLPKITYLTSNKGIKRQESYSERKRTV